MTLSIANDLLQEYYEDSIENILNKSSKSDLDKEVDNLIKRFTKKYEGTKEYQNYVEEKTARYFETATPFKGVVIHSKEYKEITDYIKNCSKIVEYKPKLIESIYTDFNNLNVNYDELTKYLGKDDDFVIEGMTHYPKVLESMTKKLKKLLVTPKEDNKAFVFESVLNAFDFECDLFYDGSLLGKTVIKEVEAVQSQVERICKKEPLTRNNTVHYLQYISRQLTTVAERTAYLELVDLILESLD